MMLSLSISYALAYPGYIQNNTGGQLSFSNDKEQCLGSHSKPSPNPLDDTKQATMNAKQVSNGLECNVTKNSIYEVHIEDANGNKIGFAKIYSGCSDSNSCDMNFGCYPNDDNKGKYDISSTGNTCIVSCLSANCNSSSYDNLL